MHPALERQLARLYGDARLAPRELAPLLEAIDASYREADDAKAALERAMEISSQELVERNVELSREVIERNRAEEDLKQALEQLQRIDRSRAQFINNAAHELGTPLTPIKIQIHLLRVTTKGSLTPQQDKSLATLERNLNRLSELLKDVLDSARLQADRLHLDLVPVDLRKLAIEAGEAFAGLAEHNGVHFEVEAPEPLLVRADPKRTAQVLYNLMSNALKFTPKGGMVRLSARAEHGEVIVSVADTGSGMEPKDIGRLFQPFSQVHDTLQSTKGGTGLGLFISRGIIEGSHGRIWAESKGPGMGSTFSFALPLAPAPTLSEPQAEPAKLRPP
jgi:signal transduction histidine kinase